jgi:transcription elongation factor GreA-like protein
MDIIEKLTYFNLTRQEATLYLTLLAEGRLTGYEATKLTGISRSNTYTALAGLVEKVKDFDTFAELFGVNSKGQSVQSSPKKEESKISEVIKEGNWIKHKIYGKGKIVKVEKTSLMVDFRMVGKKKIGMEWCLKNCEVLK